MLVEFIYIKTVKAGGNQFKILKHKKTLIVTY